ncbi:MAG: leucine-rich repeat protein [Alistipes sp.]|nr:leucine-rich repeat protein [Alistipes sp.]
MALYSRRFGVSQSAKANNGSILYTFDVTDTSKEYWVYSSAGGSSLAGPAPIAMEVDGITKAVSQKYTFSSLGTHRIELFFGDVGECAGYLANGSDAVSIDVSNLSLPDSYQLRGFFSSSSLLKEVVGLDKMLSTLPTDDYYDSYAFFQYCSSLETIDLSDLTFRTDSLSLWFWGCDVLRSVKLPNVDWADPSDVGSNFLFTDCYALTSVDLSVFSGLPCSNFEFAFDGCTSLTSVTLPMRWMASYYELSLQYMLRGCTALSSIRFNYPVPDSEDLKIEEMFSGMRSSGTFYYPSGMSASVLSALPSGWSKVLI